MRTVWIIITVGVFGVVFVMWFRREKSSAMPRPPAAVAAPFDMAIDDSFRLKLEGSVVVVGVITAGEIRPGMELVIRTPTAVIRVTVKALEGGPGKPIPDARAGDRLAVMLQGANKDQIPGGSRLSGRAQ